MRQKAFRLTDGQVDKLKRAAAEMGCTETEVIRGLIDGLDESYTKNGIEGAGESAAVAALTEQLDSQGQTIARLLDALAAAQEATRAAQTLQGANLAIDAHGGKDGRFRRAWRALRGID